MLTMRKIKETRIGLLNPYEENYAFLKQGIRNRETFVKLEKVELLSPTRIKRKEDATLKVDSPYKPQLESSIYSPYSRWESNLIRKPNPNLNMDEFESFVRIGTPQERFKLQLPPPLEEVITPDPTSAMVLQRRKSKKTTIPMAIPRTMTQMKKVVMKVSADLEQQ